MMATTLAPTSGDAYIFGKSVISDPHAVKPRIGYMSQAFSLYGDLTVAENLRFFAELRGVPRKEMAVAICSAARVLGTHRVREAPGAVPLRRHEAEARAGGDAHLRARPALPRRADHGRRPRVAPRVLAHHQRPAPSGHHGLRGHAVHGRGRPLQRDRLHDAGQDHPARHARGHEAARPGPHPRGGAAQLPRGDAARPLAAVREEPRGLGRAPARAGSRARTSARTPRSSSARRSPMPASPSSTCARCRPTSRWRSPRSSPPPTTCLARDVDHILAVAE